MTPRRTPLLAVISLFVLSSPLAAQTPERYEGPIIDMHLHGYTYSAEHDVVAAHDLD